MALKEKTMRIDVKKVLFIGLEKEREAFFAAAQQEGIVDFIDSHSKKAGQPSDAVSSYALAIKILRGLPVVEQVESTDYERAVQIVQEIIRLHELIDKNIQEQRLLRHEIARVEVFGDFSLEDIAFIEKVGGRKIQFFCTKPQGADSAKQYPDLIDVGSQHGLHYFMSIHPESRQYPGMIEMKIERPLGVLWRRADGLVNETTTAEHALKEYAKYDHFLRDALLVLLNQHNYAVACKYPAAPIEGKLFAVQGWVPVNKEKRLAALAKTSGVYVDEIAIEPSDRIPTYLENEGFHRIGEDLIKIYDVPSHEDKDPSLWVLVFFALFFAIIVGDGGYGILYLLLALYLRYRFPQATGITKRILNLSALLAVSCIIWGLLTASFFSLPIDLNSPLRRVSLVTWLAEKKAEYHLRHGDETHQQLIQEYPGISGAASGRELLQQGTVQQGERTIYPVLAYFSDVIAVDLILLIGIVHLILSMLRYVRRNWAAAGWILFLIGAYLYFPKFLDATTLTQYLLDISPAKAYSVGETLLYIGMGLAVVLSLIQNKLFGLLEITNVIQIGGDVLSYLRLYALSLAGAMVAGTMNELALGLPAVFMVIVLIVGHVMNMTLCIMGGVIHGLRLNFLEWYHYSFQGDGRLFKPLEIIKKE